TTLSPPPACKSLSFPSHSPKCTIYPADDIWTHQTDYRPPNRTREDKTMSSTTPTTTTDPTVPAPEPFYTGRTDAPVSQLTGGVILGVLFTVVCWIAFWLCFPAYAPRVKSW